MARSLLETIRSVGDNEDDANTVLKAMVKLAQDPGNILDFSKNIVVKDNCEKVRPFVFNICCHSL